MELIDMMIAVAEKDPTMFPCHVHCSGCRQSELINDLKAAEEFRELHVSCLTRKNHCRDLSA